MRLLVVLTEVFRSDGGIPKFNRALLRALSDFCQRYGAEATVLVLNDSTADLDPRYVASSSLTFRGYGRNKAAFVVRFLWAVLARPDLTLFGHINLLPLALPLTLLRRPYLLIAHGIEAWRRQPWLARHALARARTVVAVSNHTRQRLSVENGVPANRWRVFPNTLDPLFSPAQATPNPQPTLLTVCRLNQTERAKGVDQVLAVLPELRQQFPNLHYVVVGEGSDRPRLEELARTLGLSETVKFTGHLSTAELAARYAGCSVFVLPSTKEGFGIVFLETMAHSKPVVATHAGGIPEVVIEGETGLLVDRGNLRALRTALARLLADAGLRQRLGAAGRRRLEENFTFEHFRRRLVQLLAEELSAGVYSLEAERRYYCRRLPQSAREYHWLRSYLDLLPGVRLLLTGRDVLDIGAGECLYGALIADLYDARVVALELIPERMQPASSAFRLPNLSFVAGDCHRLPFRDASFDTIFGDLVLHHFPELGPVIAEIRRVLRPGGCYLGIEPNFSNPALRLSHFFKPKSANERPLSPARLRDSLEPAGFQVELHFFWRRFPQLRQRFLTTSVGIIARL